MRSTFDFSPLFRSSIGFEHLLDALDTASRIDAVDSWPAYDITKTADDHYRITMAVPGYSQGELAVTRERNLLTVSGRRSEEDAGEKLHAGIVRRDFQRRFELADYVDVVGASLVNGILTIDLQRELPEAMKPRRIEVTGEAAQPRSEAGRPRQIEAQQAA